MVLLVLVLVLMLVRRRQGAGQELVGLEARRRRHAQLWDALGRWWNLQGGGWMWRWGGRPLMIRCWLLLPRQTPPKRVTVERFGWRHRVRPVLGLRKVVRAGSVALVLAGAAWAAVCEFHLCISLEGGLHWSRFRVFGSLFASPVMASCLSKFSAHELNRVSKLESLGSCPNLGLKVGVLERCEFAESDVVGGMSCLRQSAARGDGVSPGGGGLV